MWRTVIVAQGEKLTVKDNWLVVWSDNSEQRVPIGDLYSVVIDNRAALVSVTALTTLAQANVHVYLSIPALSETTTMQKSIAG